ncbi:inactivator of retinoblastoma protein [Equine molluscum contagiosum-like virus]|nr:inactivator of retinoblastoma protein [Equine molluscum contagiosum-like virus]
MYWVRVTAAAASVCVCAWIAHRRPRTRFVATCVGAVASAAAYYWAPRVAGAMSRTVQAVSYTLFVRGERRACVSVIADEAVAALVNSVRTALSERGEHVSGAVQVVQGPEDFVLGVAAAGAQAADAAACAVQAATVEWPAGGPQACADVLMEVADALQGNDASGACESPDLRCHESLAYDSEDTLESDEEMVVSITSQTLADLLSCSDDLCEDLSPDAAFSALLETSGLYDAAMGSPESS